jgi:hypothetical protein
VAALAGWLGQPVSKIETTLQKLKKDFVAKRGMFAIFRNAQK